MTERDLIAEIEALDADTVYFIRRGDGQSWAAHIRHKGAGPSLYAVADSPTLRGAVLGALGTPEEEDDWKDLI